MFKIIYIIPYFGRLREDLPLWLESCKWNPTVNWLLVTDDIDKSFQNYPSNVRIIEMSFEQLRQKVQNLYSFPISLETPYKLCDYKPAFGEIFEEEIAGYDFWGHCDMDMIFGDIRKFLTDEILEKYERIGRWGHSILYKNTQKNNRRYRSCVNDIKNYKEVFTSVKNFFFDEMGMLEIFDALGISTYCYLKIADLHPSYWKLEIISDDIGIRKENKHRVFFWTQGTLLSYAVKDKQIYKDEFMYVHFLRRPMKLVNCTESIKSLLIVPNTIENVNFFNPDIKYIMSVSKNRMDKYWISLIKRKWKVATPIKVWIYFKGRIRGKYRKMFKNGQ